MIHGDALFLAPVVVNGTLTVRGTAHFSAGVVAKDDALVSGMLKVGSDDATGLGSAPRVAARRSAGP